MWDDLRIPQNTTPAVKKAIELYFTPWSTPFLLNESAPIPTMWGNPEYMDLTFFLSSYVYPWCAVKPYLPCVNGYTIYSRTGYTYEQMLAQINVKYTQCFRLYDGDGGGD